MKAARRSAVLLMLPLPVDQLIRLYSVSLAIISIFFFSFLLPFKGSAILSHTHTLPRQLEPLFRSFPIIIIRHLAPFASTQWMDASLIAIRKTVIKKFIQPSSFL